LGELGDASWSVEQVDGGVNHVFTGVASDGTFDEFLRLNAGGLDNVSFDFEGPDGTYSGDATLLRPIVDGNPGGSLISIESIQEPSKVSQVTLR